MTSLELARRQFGITTLCHFIFVPVTIGLATFTSVGEHGAQVSGGRRRRIAAARLLLSPARLLIADEPAAHLDGGGAAALMAEARAGRGVLVIAHESHGLERFDEVLTLRDGRLVDAHAQARGAS